MSDSAETALQVFTIVFREREAAASYTAPPETIQQIAEAFTEEHASGVYQVFQAGFPRTLAIRFVDVLYIT